LEHFLTAGCLLKFLNFFIFSNFSEFFLFFRLLQFVYEFSRFLTRAGYLLEHFFVTAGCLLKFFEFFSFFQLFQNFFTFAIFYEFSRFLTRAGCLWNIFCDAAAFLRLLLCLHQTTTTDEGHRNSLHLRVSGTNNMRNSVFPSPY